MRRVLCILLCLLCLGGCSNSLSLPRATEPRNFAQISVLGVDYSGGRVSAFAATEGRGGAQPAIFQAEGDSLAGARLRSRDQGQETVGYAHVENMIVSEAAAQEYLSELLRYSLQNKEQSLESKLWVLRGAALEEVFTAEQDLAKRLTVLKTGAEAGTSLPACSLRQAAARLRDDGTLLLPALTLKEGAICFESYLLLREGKPAAYLEGELARAAALLSGASVYWTDRVKTAAGREVLLELQGRGCRVKADVSEGKLRGLNLRVQISGRLYENWAAEEVSDLEGEVKAIVGREFGDALSTLQTLGADGADLRRQAGLSAPWRWGLIQREWAARFSALPLNISVEAELRAGA